MDGHWTETAIYRRQSLDPIQTKLEAAHLLAHSWPKFDGKFKNILAKTGNRLLHLLFVLRWDFGIRFTDNSPKIVCPFPLPVYATSLYAGNKMVRWSTANSHWPRDSIKMISECNLPALEAALACQSANPECASGSHYLWIYTDILHINPAKI